MILIGLLILLGLITQFIDKPSLFKKPVNVGKIITLAIFLLIAVLSLIKGVKDDSDLTKNFKTTDSLKNEIKFQNKLIDTLRRENKEAQKEYEDSLKYYSIRDINEIDSTAFGMTKIFAENSNINIKEHVKTQNKIDKLDTTKKIQAYVGLILEPHNIFVLTRTDVDTLKAQVIIENFGEGIAYEMKTQLILIYQINGAFYKLKDQPFEPIGTNFLPTARRTLSGGLAGSKRLLDNIQFVYAIVNGSFYLNDNHTSLKTFQAATIRGFTDTESYKYTLPISIDSLVKSAKILDP